MESVTFADLHKYQRQSLETQEAAVDTLFDDGDHEVADSVFH